MTFEDMMQMKRLGDTAVSPDGKWLAYAVTTVDLVQNRKNGVVVAGDCGSAPTNLPQSSWRLGRRETADCSSLPTGTSVLFLSDRDNGQQIWTADFDPATGATSNAKKLTAIATEADNAKWSPDGQVDCFHVWVYPDCPQLRRRTSTPGTSAMRAAMRCWRRAR
jgi:Tol biopolymer transport system component